MATGLSGPREEARMHPTSQTNSSFLIAFFFLLLLFQQRRAPRLRFFVF